MRVLSQTPGHSIRIGEGVMVRILAVTGNRVRLMINAPESESIDSDSDLRRPRKFYACSTKPVPVIELVG
ncbi:carbon storage regulator [bacterium]|nr:carbon storage regulator [bacterium]